VRIARPDTSSMILAGACAVGIVVLALFHVTIPDVLTFLAMGALGISGGTALNTSTATPSDSTAQRIADSLASLEQLIGGARRASTPAAAPARPAAPGGIPAQPAAPAAAASNGAAR